MFYELCLLRPRQIPVPMMMSIARMRIAPILVVFQVPLLLHEIRVEKQTEMYPKIHRFNGYYPSIVFVSCAVFD
jgi:hypothetical protein